jgi:hypothetical protein
MIVTSGSSSSFFGVLLSVLFVDLLFVSSSVALVLLALFVLRLLTPKEY